MGQPYVGEIRMVGFNFPPRGWMQCNGQLLPISEYETLFNLIGTTYGGDGQSTFALPDLRSRIPLHVGTAADGNTYTLGESGGVEQVTLTTSQIPAHSHLPQASTSNQGPTGPSGNVWAASPVYTEYFATPDGTAMAAGAIASAGGGQPHDNMVPFLVINFVISLFGVFPSPT
jgi:microcystin-dependent protein